jgi:hypothetical protein
VIPQDASCRKVAHQADLNAMECNNNKRIGEHHQDNLDANLFLPIGNVCGLHRTTTCDDLFLLPPLIPPSLFPTSSTPPSSRPLSTSTSSCPILSMNRCVPLRIPISAAGQTLRGSDHVARIPTDMLQQSAAGGNDGHRQSF